MGEIAEMMLEGFMCEQCGEIIGDIETGEGQGFPGLCAGCAALPENKHRDDPPAEMHVRQHYRNRGHYRGQHPCPKSCGMTFINARAAQQHARDKHGERQ